MGSGNLCLTDSPGDSNVHLGVRTTAQCKVYGDTFIQATKTILLGDFPAGPVVRRSSTLPMRGAGLSPGQRLESHAHIAVKKKNLASWWECNVLGSLRTLIAVVRGGVLSRDEEATETGVTG